MKVTFVTPRYGDEILGGAEHAARILAERLVATFDWEVRCYTSCALDVDTWANDLEPGVQNINGVEVSRFPTSRPRDPYFNNTSERVFRSTVLTPPALQERWIDEQGPTMPTLLAELANDPGDVTVFYPYLYYPTVRGIDLVRKAVLHPAAHDEPLIRLPIFQKTFASADAFVFQTEGGRQIVQSIFPVAHKSQLLLGLGVEPKKGDFDAFLKTSKLNNRPYILCLGRVDHGKGSSILTRYFIEYKKRNPSNLALVLAGPIRNEMEVHEDIFVTGPLTEEEKWGALRNCSLLVQPSPFEAFSLVLIEAWTAAKAVLVNASCAATREHVEKCSGGLWFDNYYSFESSLSRFLDNLSLTAHLGELGKQYVDGNFSWPVLIDRYGQFLETIAAKKIHQRA